MSHFNPPRFVGVREIAAILNVTQNTIYYWVSRNEIPYIRMGRHLRFDVNEVIASFKSKTRERKPSCHAKASAVKTKLNRSLTTENTDHGDPQKEDDHGNL